MKNFGNGMFYFLAVTIIVFISMGCAGDRRNSPILPDEGAANPLQTEDVKNLPVPMTNGHGTWGYYYMVIDETDMSIDIVPDRSSDAHYNVTWVKDICPKCITASVKTFDPNTRTFVIELHTTNPTNKIGYDVRFIVRLDGTGNYDMLDPDNYTKLHDPTNTVNPFRALAKEQVNRSFLPAAYHVTTFKLYISEKHKPQNNIPFIIDVSYPTRCQEPYQMTDIKVIGQFPPGGGGSVTVELVALDAQKDWGKVFLRTKGIFTPADIEMTPGATVGTFGKKYTATFSNTVGGGLGLTPILIEAYTANTAIEPYPLNDYARIFADPGAESAIAGEVFNALTKQAVNGSTVNVINTGGGANPLPYTVTDGTYYVKVLAGTYAVNALHSNYFLQDTIQDVVVPANSVVYVCFGLAPKYLNKPEEAIASISGHIRDATTQKPIVGAQATLDGGPAVGGVIQARITNVNGHYCFYAVPTYTVTSWKVKAFHPNYIPQEKSNIPSGKNKATPQVDFDLQPVGNPPVWKETFEPGPSNVGTLQNWTFKRVYSETWPGGSNVSTYHDQEQPGDVLWHVHDQVTTPVQDIFYINGTCDLPPDDTTNGWIPPAYEGARYMWYGETYDNTPASSPHSGSFIDEWNGVTGNGGTSSNGANAGIAQTGPINLKGYTQLTLVFQSWWEIEAVDPSIQYDAMDVLISTNGTHWNRIDRLNPLAEPIPDSGNAKKAYTSAGYNQAAVWSPSIYDISSYAGNSTVYLRFDFDTIDHLYNGFRGWIVDDIVIWPYKM